MVECVLFCWDYRWGAVSKSVVNISTKNFVVLILAVCIQRISCCRLGYRGTLPPTDQHRMLAGLGAAKAMQDHATVHSNVWTTRFLQHDEMVESGDILFACCCVPCASAKAKSTVDKSDCLYNFCCWTPGGAYQFIRLAYGIDGVCGDDLAWSCICPCLQIRQALTEGKRRGVALSVPPQAGTNSIPWGVSLFDCSVCELCETTICFPCVTHTIHQHLQPKADSCCFDFCCIAPTSMYGQVRHHYGIISDVSCAEDLLLPVACFPCALNRARKELQRHSSMVHAAQAIVPGTGYSRF